MSNLDAALRSFADYMAAKADGVDEGVLRSQWKFDARRALKRIHGTNCFYCGLHMPKRDRTIEHLLEKARGGGNDLPNLRLAHYACNAAVEGRSVQEKIALSAAASQPTDGAPEAPPKVRTP